MSEQIKETAMTDIQKMIEEEAKNFMDRNVIFGCASTDIQDAFRRKTFISGANFALSQLQHANRWRKSGTEELPEIGKQIVCRGSKGNCHLSKSISNDGIHWL